jgi:hypothetical protein
MTRYLTTIQGPKSRNDAMQLVAKAPIGTRVELKAAKRTGPQNDRMWAMLTDVSRQLPWHGVKLTPDSWKLMFLDALRREIGSEFRIVPNLDGDGFVNLGTSSSDLSKDEMSMLIELIFKFGAEHDVVFADDKAEAA